MESLSIITPVTRMGNLREIAESISKAQSKTDFFDITWYCIFDAEEYGHVQLPHDVGIFIFARPCFSGWTFEEKDGTHYQKKVNSHGGKQRNYALSQFTDGWVYFLDDDNAMQEDFLADLADEIKLNPDKKAFVFDQYNKGPNLRLKAAFENIKVMGIDTAQMVLHRNLIGAAKWPNRQCGDGHLAEELYKFNPEAFKIGKGRVWYNYLR